MRPSRTQRRTVFGLSRNVSATSSTVHKSPSAMTQRIALSDIRCYNEAVTESGQAGVGSTDLPVVNTWIEQVSTVATVLVSRTDPRGSKAVMLAADAGQWLKCRDRRGRKAYGIPSSKFGVYYLTTRYTCTCKDAEFGHECKHQLAVRLHCELVADQRALIASEAEDIFARFAD